MSRRRPFAIFLAVLFLGVLLGSLAARYWAVGEAVGLSGPTHIAADGDRVVLFAGGELFLLSPEGVLVDVAPLARTGLDDDPIDLHLLPDGNLLVAAQRPARIHLCDIDSWSCRPVARSAMGWVERQFKLLPGEANGEWLMSDARGDALWRLLPDTAPHSLLPAGTLAGPNGIADAGAGGFWVADTDHRRIVEILPSGDGGYEVRREHSTANEFHAGQNWFPMMLERGGDGRWWVTQGAEFSKGGADLLIYDPDDGPVARVELPGGAYPTDLVAAADAMLVTDMDRFEVYRVAADSLNAARFGDDRFRTRMADLRAERGRLDALSRWALAGVIAGAVLMIGAAAFATPREKRWTPVPPVFDWDAAPDRAPRTSGIHWLKRKPAIDRSLQWAEWLAYAAVLLPAFVLLGLWLWIREQAGPDAGADIETRLGELGLAMLLLGVLLALLTPIIRMSLRAMKTRLGTDGRRLYIRRHDGREIAVDPSQLSYTDRMILYREYSLPLAGGKQQSIYEPGEVETWLGPLLREAQRLGPVEALKHQWRHSGSRQLWWFIAALVLAGAVIALVAAGILSFP
jgi:hypothetical protein